MLLLPFKHFTNSPQIPDFTALTRVPISRLICRAVAHGRARQAAPAAGAFPRLISCQYIFIYSLLHDYSASIGCLSVCGQEGAGGAVPPVSPALRWHLTGSPFNPQQPSLQPVPALQARGALACAQTGANQLSCKPQKALFQAPT